MADCVSLNFLGKQIVADNLKGYEIHMGHTEFTRAEEEHPLVIRQRRGERCESIEGTTNASHNVFGTYIHGIFDNDEFRRSLLNAIRAVKGLEALPNTHNLMSEKQQSYEHLADVVEESLDMKKLAEIMGEA